MNEKRREIKFRAWDDLNEHMIPYDGYGSVKDFWMMAQSHDWPVMQFTGLKDKNDKEIYEGDVVKCPVESPFQRMHGKWVLKEVIYRNGRWIISYLTSHTGAQLPRGYTAGEIHTYLEQHDKDAYFIEDEVFSKLTVEVIGNIYENSTAVPQ